MEPIETIASTPDDLLCEYLGKYLTYIYKMSPQGRNKNKIFKKLREILRLHGNWRNKVGGSDIARRKNLEKARNSRKNNGVLGKTG